MEQSQQHRLEEKPFNNDVVANKGFLYTTNAPLSSRLANGRLSEIAREKMPVAGLDLVDVGCGDGTYTLEFLELPVAPRRLVGLDPAAEAVRLASDRTKDPRVSFCVGSAYELPFAADEFHWAHLRGVLHHMEKPAVAIKEAFRVARQILIIEPNGYNPVLKVIEKASPYHRQHDERSYTSKKIASWIQAGGGRVVSVSHVGLVPFFCPAPAARLLKTFEPVVESIPGLRLISCAVSVIVAQRNEG
jgi:SAM-dependent methyltransferase